MTTSRQIITSALTLGLNRLSAGETLDPDLSALCLTALNEVVDTLNGDGGSLWKQTTATATVTGSSALLSVWGLAPGAAITLVTQDGWPVNPSTLEAIKSVPSTTGTPTIYASSGDALHFYPAPVGLPIVVLSKESADAFADLDTDYAMPAGWLGALSALLAEAVALPVVGEVTPTIARKAAAARQRLLAKVEPAILNPGIGDGLNSFLRGY